MKREQLSAPPGPKGKIAWLKAQCASVSVHQPETILSIGAGPSYRLRPLKPLGSTCVLFYRVSAVAESRVKGG